VKRPATDPGRLVAIGMGANLRAPRLGTPASTLAWAGERLGMLLAEVRLAPLYRTEPISHLAQPDFWNTVALAELPAPDSPLGTPRRLLGALKELEAEAGRGPAERDAPRVLDLDLLFFGDLQLAEDALPTLLPGSQPAEPGVWRGALTLPHPRLRERLFVLAPLRDLAPDLALPPDGRTVAELYAAIAGSQRIEQAATRCNIDAKRNNNPPDRADRLPDS
jgi:2-amino-4-hydroxy-6-hydroxymethyldihydropteridine diphosphokinase